MSKNMNRALSAEQQIQLLTTLRSRFEKNMERHKAMNWSDLEARLVIHPEKLWSLNEMEQSGGEPDVVGFDAQSGAYIFFDCSPESPKGRRSICYDDEALRSRKEHKPKSSATHMAAEMGIEMLDESEYRALQKLGSFDTKTSSWVSTPADIRKRGGAIFCDCRYGHVFMYHNGAESYYGSRGFRGSLHV